MKQTQVWVWLTDDEVKELEEKEVVELNSAYPVTIGKVWGYKNKQCSK